MKKQISPGALLSPVPAVLVSCGTVEKPNLLTVAWVGTICTHPAMVSISVRPERYSYPLIKESGSLSSTCQVNQWSARWISAGSDRAEIPINLLSAD